jgi:hypothetical protein
VRGDIKDRNACNKFIETVLTLTVKPIIFGMQHGYDDEPTQFQGFVLEEDGSWVEKVKTDGVKWELFPFPALSGS